MPVIFRDMTTMAAAKNQKQETRNLELFTNLQFEFADSVPYGNFVNILDKNNQKRSKCLTLQEFP